MTARKKDAGEGPRCGANTGDGQTCQLPAGWGTDHVGVGNCRKHFGNTRMHRIKGARGLAVEQYKAMRLGEEIDINPLDAMLWCVRMSAGAAAFYQEINLGLSQEAIDNSPWAATEEGLTALMDIVSGVGNLYGAERDRLVKTSEACIRVGLDARRVALAESQGESWAIEVGAAIDEVGDLTAAQRKAVKAAIARKLLAIPTTAIEVTGG